MNCGNLIQCIKLYFPAVFNNLIISITDVKFGVSKLISKLNFYKLIPYHMDRQGPPS